MMAIDSPSVYDDSFAQGLDERDDMVCSENNCSFIKCPEFLLLYFLQVLFIYFATFAFFFRLPTPPNHSRHLSSLSASIVLSVLCRRLTYNL
jgi:hypothetical protein